MSYLETPAGVGYSYTSNKSFYNLVNDEITARDNLAFLENWLVKFPEYKNRDLFLTGESYARYNLPFLYSFQSRMYQLSPVIKTLSSDTHDLWFKSWHYVPQLVNLILKSTIKLNLKRIDIGNPLLDFNTDFNSVGEYYWSHGLISDATFGLMQNVCNFSQIRRQATKESLAPECSMVNKQLRSEVGKLINTYHVILDVCLHQQARLLSLTEEKIDVCLPDKPAKYLNRKDVQQDRLVGVAQWAPCTRISVKNYTMDMLEITTVSLLGALNKLGVPVLVYSGDQDSVIPLIGTRVLVKELATELGLNTTMPYQALVGGWTQVYADNLTYATIRGAAHEAPFSQPVRSLLLLTSFLQGKPLPVLSPNKH